MQCDGLIASFDRLLTEQLVTSTSHSFFFSFPAVLFTHHCQFLNVFLCKYLPWREEHQAIESCGEWYEGVGAVSCPVVPPKEYTYIYVCPYMCVSVHATHQSKRLCCIYTNCFKALSTQCRSSHTDYCMLSLSLPLPSPLLHPLPHPLPPIRTWRPVVLVVCWRSFPTTSPQAQTPAMLLSNMMMGGVVAVRMPPLKRS